MKKFDQTRSTKQPQETQADDRILQTNEYYDIRCTIRPSVCRLSSATFVQPTQPVEIEIFGNISTPFATIRYFGHPHHGKFYGDCHKGTPPSGVNTNARVVAEYSDFGPEYYNITSP